MLCLVHCDIITSVRSWGCPKGVKTTVKAKIHPKYEKTTISCACGAVYHVGSTKKNLKVEICAKCHPYFTGVQKIIDTGGRVEKFRKKYGME